LVGSRSSGALRRKPIGAVLIAPQWRPPSIEKSRLVRFQPVMLSFIPATRLLGSSGFTATSSSAWRR
jgi:hypothetical protein